MLNKVGDALVSVIIPTYNQPKLLQLTIESVLAQTYPNIELIVIDDGSTEDTAAMIAQYKGKLTYIKQENQGGPAATNNGIRAASGEYLTFLDHDDLMLPTKIERQVQLLDTRPEIGLVHCRYYHIDGNGNIMDKIGLLPANKSLKELVYSNFLWAGGPMIRRQCLDQVGLYDEELWSEDWDLWLRIALAGYEFACIQEPLGAYRILAGSKMSHIARLEQSIFLILDRVFADTRLPADVASEKDQVYKMWRFWISCRYYAVGQWAEAQRNLAEALVSPSLLLAQPDTFVQLLRDNALNSPVGEPVRFVNDVFEHLPPGHNDVSRYRSQVLGQVYTALALRNYGLGRIDEAKRQLAESITMNPDIVNQPENFFKALAYNALSLPVKSPLQYVNTVFQNLPQPAQQLKQARSHILSQVSIGYAFESYHAGQRRLVVQQVLTALRYRPAWLSNKGVTAIFFRSLLGLSLEAR